MSQTLALLLDAYRDLNARKMFWIVLIISTLVAASFGAVGLTSTGISIFTWHINSPVNNVVVTPATFYKQLFLSLGVGTWLTTFATCLALISTASIYPDFIASGAVDLYLSRPIGRLRLFFTKYLCGLLFVSLQIACFCLASFLVIGIRGRAWEPSLFLAVPIVVIFYSYLYCVCVLVGVVTRSTVAAVLLTLLFWMLAFGVHATEVTLLTLQLHSQRELTALDERLSRDTIELQELDRDPAATRPATVPTTTPAAPHGAVGRVLRWLVPTTASVAARRQQLQTQIDSDKERRPSLVGEYERPHHYFFLAMGVLPKTSETIDLLRRELVKRADLPEQRNPENDNGDDSPNNTQTNNTDVQNLQASLESRSVGWVVGTSVAFEAVILFFAAWIFCRRDY